MRRDAAATKAAIVRAARRLLATRAYGDITLKAIAEQAEISQPLILKYFGNKDSLLAHVMSFEEDSAALLDAPVAELGAHMVRHMVQAHVSRSPDPLLRIVFAPVHSSRGDVLRDNFRTQITERLARRLDGPDAPVRAELAVGMLLGLTVMCRIAQGEALGGTPPEEIVGRYAPVVQRFLTP
ncbi:hypothetical protein SRB5_30190 [Streptomyces sp. RB5]|uniref:HTH tetR-type domain-containing protein n=1 Tax=Streptomyces smaragdinus TaxID=2585196 RepID=A0A7K0CHC3_9ACTN|nr:TetR family transcriptional regulator [Streptomyces smaragdinus]MQY12880.1 hypothetical protein [Streptomyces smaragdinus]